MAGKARQGDVISHGGFIGMPLQTSVRVNGLLVARLGDPVGCNQHGPQSITSGSGTVKCGGSPVAKIGDLISCGATIVGGSANVIAS
mgnify:CR=1 FL=1